MSKDLVKDGMMPWHKRGGASYYLRSVWADGRTVKRYYGRGPAAELAARLDEQERRRRQVQAESLRAEEARLAAPEAALGALKDACHLMVEATLTAAGYHRANYSAWRRRRAQSES